MDSVGSGNFEPEIVILAGRGALYGTGHSVRMGELSRILNTTTRPGKSRVRVHLVYLEGDTIPPRFLDAWGGCGEGTLFLLDARDVDPTPLAKLGSVLALDNRCPNRLQLDGSDRIRFYDTIPHPEAPLEETLRRSLISPLFLSGPEQEWLHTGGWGARRGRAKDTERGTSREEPASPFAPSGRSNQLFVYSGSFRDTEALDRYLVSLLERRALESVFRCGDSPPPPGIFDGTGEGRGSGFRYATRLERDLYRDTILGSRFVAAHFGITILEAWYTGAIPILMATGSDLHDRLSRDLSLRASLPRLDRSGAGFCSVPGDLFSGGYRLEGGLRPTGEGYRLLVEALFHRLEAAGGN